MSFVNQPFLNPWKICSITKNSGPLKAASEGSGVSTVIGALPIAWAIGMIAFGLPTTPAPPASGDREIL